MINYFNERPLELAPMSKAFMVQTLPENIPSFGSHHPVLLLHCPSAVGDYST